MPAPNPLPPPIDGPCVCIVGQPNPCGCGDPAPPQEVPVGGPLFLLVAAIGVAIIARWRK